MSHPLRLLGAVNKIRIPFSLNILLSKFVKKIVRGTVREPEPIPYDSHPYPRLSRTSVTEQSDYSIFHGVTPAGESPKMIPKTMPYSQMILRDLCHRSSKI